MKNINDNSQFITESNLNIESTVLSKNNELSDTNIKTSENIIDYNSQFASESNIETNGLSDSDLSDTHIKIPETMSEHNTIIDLQKNLIHILLFILHLI